MAAAVTTGDKRAMQEEVERGPGTIEWRGELKPAITSMMVEKVKIEVMREGQMVSPEGGRTEREELLKMTNLDGLVERTPEGEARKSVKERENGEGQARRKRRVSPVSTEVRVARRSRHG